MANLTEFIMLYQSSIAFGDFMSSSEFLKTEQSRSDSSEYFAGFRIDAEVLQALAMVFDVAFILAISLVVDRVIIGVPSWWGDFSSLSLMLAFIFSATLALRGGYRMESLVSPQKQIVQIVVAWTAAFVVLAWCAFLFKVSASFSRVGVTFFFVGGGAGLLIGHTVAAAILRSRLSNGRLCLQRVLTVVFGDMSELDQIRLNLSSKGLNVVGSHLILPNTKSFQSVRLGLEAKIRETLAGSRCDAVLIFAPWNNQRMIAELLEVVRPFPTPAVLMADRTLNRVVTQKRVLIGNMNGFEVQRAPLSRTDRVIKRAFDLVIASFGLVLLALPMLITSLAILFETGRPIFFRQGRKGFGGRIFEIFKFRSMTVQENGDTVVQARRNDPRVTPLGRILRRASIDELPQLFNVLRGEMSIVGPRPHAIAHDNQYDELIATYAFRHHVKPGITGWAQVNGHRGETRELHEMEARVEHDLWYINHWSIWLDMRIVIQTATTMILLDKNAY